MQEMKLKVALIGVVATLAIAAGALAATSPRNALASQRASLSGVLAENYSSLGSIAGAAEAIVVARADTQLGIMSGHLPFTRTTVTVLEVLKGTAARGQQLGILETGGEYQPVARDGSRPNVPSQQIDFEGVPVLATGQAYVLFLRAYTGDLTTHAYAVLGVFQGKLPVNDAGRISFEDWQGDRRSPAFSVARTTEGRPLAEILVEARTALR